MLELKVGLTNKSFNSCFCAFTLPPNLPVFLDLISYFSVMLSREKRSKIAAVNLYIVEVDEITLNQMCSFISLLGSAV